MDSTIQKRFRQMRARSVTFSMLVCHGKGWGSYTKAGIHLERGFASMPRPPVKRHTIFCHACPSPALLSTACAIVINNKTDKTRGLPCLAPISAPSVLFIMLLRIIRLKIRRFQDFCYVAPPFEQCCTSSTSSDAVRAASLAHAHILQMAACFHAPYKRSNIVFLCVICPELLHSYHNCNVDSFFATDEQLQYG